MLTFLLIKSSTSGIENVNRHKKVVWASIYEQADKFNAMGLKTRFLIEMTSNSFLAEIMNF
jgi:hypothetical protein